VEWLNQFNTDGLSIPTNKGIEMSYECALTAAGCNVVEFHCFGSYQGDWYAMIEIDGQKGVVTGCYGSCSYCDAFEGEFGWNDSEKQDYQERLADFGKTYLPALPAEHFISPIRKTAEDGNDWG
jgi:hypothetical protein